MDARDKVYEFLHKTFDKKDFFVEKASRYVMLNRGHLWRPLVVLKVAEAYFVPFNISMPYAAAIECVHTSTLVQDDMPCMDNSKIRRGRESCHCEFGEDIANLCVIYLINEAIMLTSTGPAGGDKNSKMMKEVAETGEKLLKGQEIDLRHTGEKNLKEILRFYSFKSGALYGSAAVLGGILGSATDEEIVLLRRFGVNLGIAYQLGDDLYDRLGGIDLGKPTGQDSKQKTPIDLVGVDEVKKLRTEYETKSRKSLRKIDRNFSELEELITKISGTHEDILCSSESGK